MKVKDHFSAAVSSPLPPFWHRPPVNDLLIKQKIIQGLIGLLSITVSLIGRSHPEGGKDHMTGMSIHDRQTDGQRETGGERETKKTVSDRETDK